MKIFCEHKTELVPYVTDLLDNLKPDLPLTMTITQWKSGGYSVFIATEGSLEDIGEQTARFFSLTQVNT